MSQFGLTDWGGFAGLSNTGTTANNYNWGGGSSLVESGAGVFSDALGAWVDIEKIKGQSSSSAQAQDATRNATMYPSGSGSGQPGTAGLAGPGMSMSPQMLIVGGVLIIGAVMLLK
jgi:hypothetical protein